MATSLLQRRVTTFGFCLGILGMFPPVIFHRVPRWLEMFCPVAVAIGPSKTTSGQNCTHFSGDFILLSVTWILSQMLTLHTALISMTSTSFCCISRQYFFNDCGWNYFKLNFLNFSYQQTWKVTSGNVIDSLLCWSWLMKFTWCKFNHTVILSS